MVGLLLYLPSCWYVAHTPHFTELWRYLLDQFFFVIIDSVVQIFEVDGFCVIWQ